MVFENRNTSPDFTLLCSKAFSDRCFLPLYAVLIVGNIRYEKLTSANVTGDSKKALFRPVVMSYADRSN